MIGCAALCAAAVAAGLVPFPKSGVVDLPAGEVRVTVVNAPRHSLYISNHDHLDARPVVFPVIGATNLTIRGHGTRLILDAPCLAFLFQDCDRVSLEDVSVDWEIPACREGTIESLSSAGTCFRMHDPILRQGRSMIRIFRGVTHEMLPGTGEVYLSQDAVAQADGRWWLPHDFSQDGAGAKVGDVLAFRPFLRRFPALVVNRTKDTVFRRVVVHTAWGMALLAQKSENVAWDGGGVWPSGRRFASTNADATHFSNVKGLVRVENCRFEAMMDDAINVHSTCLAIRDVLSPTEIRCRYMHDQAVGFDVFSAGDRLRFIKGDTMDCGEETTVRAVRRETAREVVLTLSSPLPAGYGVGDAVENADWQCAVVFRGNQVLRNRARGALFTTPHPVLIESNRFERSTSSALLFAGDASGWYESGACRDVVIRGNLFVDCMTAFSPHGLGRALITFNPSVRKPEAQRRRYHSGIRIEDNRFETFRVPLAYAFSTEDVVWRNNTIIWNEDYPSVGEDGPFVWKNCKGVRVEK